MRVFITIIFLSVSLNVFGQNLESINKGKRFFVKGSVGTSWIILPKVFLIDAAEPRVHSQILPAKNGFAGMVGFQSVIEIGGAWVFTPELDITYLNGQIRVDFTDSSDINAPVISETVQKNQSYVRAEIPLNFGVFSRDNFWVSFGPIVYFTLYDNKGFDDAIYELPTRSNVNINSDTPVGVRFRLAAYIPVGPNGYIDIKFESDLGSHFKYENDTYDAKFSFQNVSVGYGWKVNNRK